LPVGKTSQHLLLSAGRPPTQRRSRHNCHCSNVRPLSRVLGKKWHLHEHCKKIPERRGMDSTGNGKTYQPEANGWLLAKAAGLFWDTIAAHARRRDGAVGNSKVPATIQTYPSPFCGVAAAPKNVCANGDGIMDGSLRSMLWNMWFGNGVGCCMGVN